MRYPELDQVQLADTVSRFTRALCTLAVLASVAVLAWWGFTG